VALIYPEPSKGGRGNKNPSKTEKISPAHLSYAREIVRYPDLAYQGCAKKHRRILRGAR
jgi:hypothetical protein